MEDCIKLFNVLGYDVSSKTELYELMIPRDRLLNLDLLKQIQTAIPEVSRRYKSSKLTCLHKNSKDKQKFPIINFVRQVLKCNDLHLAPFIVCKGYNKSTGKKLLDRYFKIKDIVKKDTSEMDSSEMDPNE